MPDMGDLQHPQDPPLRIGLFGPYHSRNLGDTATQYAVMAALRKRNPRLQFLGICLDPADAARTHRIEATDMTGRDPRIVSPDQPQASQPPKASPIRRLLPDVAARWLERLACTMRIARLVRRIDVLVVSGGGQIDDFWGGPWGRPFELIAWTLLCRIQGRKVVVFGTGLDNLSTRLGTWMAFNAMRLAHYRMFRDGETLGAMQQAGFRMNGSMGPDPAFSLDAPASRAVSEKQAGQQVVVVCPISESAWKRQVDAAYLNYRRELVGACRSLLRKGVRIHLSNSQSGMDVPLLHEIAEELRSDPGLAHNPPVVRIALTVDEYCALAAEADLVIASRLHGVILPIVVGTPVLAVSYMPKVTRMMFDAGLEGQCIELPALSGDALARMAFDAMNDASTIRLQLRTINERFRRLLAESYDELLAVAGSHRGTH